MTQSPAETSSRGGNDVQSFRAFECLAPDGQELKSPDGQAFWNAIEYHEIVPHEKIVSSTYFSDSEGNKVEPAQLGIEHEAIEGACDVTLFEDLGDGRTKLTRIRNEPMESARDSGQLEGWNQILDKVAAVVAQAK
jgi:uncharacterized protein YndB with AHSA1/START domain